MSGSPLPNIDLSGNILEFFQSAVGDAMSHHGFEATSAAQSYLVGVLADYARPDQLSGETLSRPLTLLLDEAMHASGHERFERLRSLGDGVLYVSGFFGGHLENRGVELDYVRTLGARAYDALSIMLHGAAGSAAFDPAHPDVFRELAVKFAMFVDLLSRVADTLFANSARTDRAILELYERWLKTRSTSLASALSARGVVPLRGDGTLH